MCNCSVIKILLMSEYKNNLNIRKLIVISPLNGKCYVQLIYSLAPSY